MTALIPNSIKRIIVERLVSLLEESRLEMLARRHGIRQKRDDGGIAKTLAAYLCRAEVDSAILLAPSRGNTSEVLRGAATVYKDAKITECEGAN